MKRAGRAAAVAITVAFAASSWWGAARAAETPMVRAAADATSPRIGATVTVTVKIRSAHNTGSVPFTLVYDPRILEFVAARSVEGGFLSKDGSHTSFLATSAAQNGGLRGVVVGLSRLRSDKGVGGKGTLCKLVFRALAPGVSPLAFARATVLDPAASSMAADFRGGSITVRPSP